MFFFICLSVIKNPHRGFFQNRLINDKSLITRQMGNFGKIGAAQSIHFMGGLTRLKDSGQLIVDSQGDLVAVHDLNGLVELLGVDDITSALEHLGVNGDLHTLFEVKGSQSAGIGLDGFDQDTLDAGHGGFAGNGAHQGGYGFADALAVEDDFHSGDLREKNFYFIGNDNKIPVEWEKGMNSFSFLRTYCAFGRAVLFDLWCSFFAARQRTNQENEARDTAPCNPVSVCALMLRYAPPRLRAFRQQNRSILGA